MDRLHEAKEARYRAEALIPGVNGIASVLLKPQKKRLYLLVMQICKANPLDLHAGLMLHESQEDGERISVGRHGVRAHSAVRGQVLSQEF